MIKVSLSPDLSPVIDSAKCLFFSELSVLFQFDEWREMSIPISPVPPSPNEQ